MKKTLEKIVQIGIIAITPFLQGFRNPIKPATREFSRFNKPYEEVIKMVKTPAEANEYCSSFLQYKDMMTFTEEIFGLLLG